MEKDICTFSVVNIAPNKREYPHNFFLFIHKNIRCGYSLEAPCRGASNEYPQHMFLWRKKKNINIFRLEKKAFYLELQYGSGKRTNFFFSFRGPILQSAIFRRVVWSKPFRVKKIYSKLCARYSEDISGPQCTHDIRSVCEYLRVATDYSVQVSLTTQIILSDDNQTKIVTTAIIILTLVY